MKTATFEYGVYPEDEPRGGSIVYWANASGDFHEISYDELEDGDVWVYALPSPPTTIKSASREKLLALLEEMGVDINQIAE